MSFIRSFQSNGRPVVANIGFYTKYDTVTVTLVDDSMVRIELKERGDSVVLDVARHKYIKGPDCKMYFIVDGELQIYLDKDKDYPRLRVVKDGFMFCVINK